MISIPNNAIINIFNPDVSPFFKLIGEMPNRDSIALSLFYLVENQKENSKFKPYLNYLPKSMSEHPLFYTAEKKDFLKGSYMIERINLWENQIEDEYTQLQKKFSLYEYKIDNFTLENYKFSRTIVWSRNFSLTYNTDENNNDISHFSLIPLADMFNFDPNKLNTYWYFDVDKKNFVLKAMNSIQKGEEVI